MAFPDFRSNPQWLAAVARERDIRESGYLRLPFLVAGGAFMLPPLTLRQQMVLFAAGNPIVRGAPATAADAGMFLWALRPEYSPANTDGRAAFKETVQAMALDWEAVIRDLRSYYADQNLDAPKPSRIKRVAASAPAVSGSSVHVVEMWASGCPMSRDEILDSPIICLNQERRAFAMKQPKHGIIGGALSNAAEKEIMREFMAAQPTPVPPPSEPTPAMRAQVSRKKKEAK